MERKLTSQVNLLFTIDEAIMSQISESDIQVSQEKDSLESSSDEEHSLADS